MLPGILALITASTEPMETQPATPPAPTGLPIFYSRPELLTPEAHGAYSLSHKPNYGFSRRVNSVPINAVELALVQRYYPIVFSNEPVPYPLALLGLKNDDNLFVDAGGVWAPDTYIPAYVRRYPFIFVQQPGEAKFALGIDAAAPQLVRGAENPLFKDGVPAELANNALKFCHAFQLEHEQTKVFTAALKDEGLFVSRNADLQSPSGAKLRFGPINVIDEDKFAALPAAKLENWQRRGWLGFVYAHLFSFANWSSLLARSKA